MQTLARIKNEKLYYVIRLLSEGAGSNLGGSNFKPEPLEDRQPG